MTMPDPDYPYSCFRPLLAADKSWAALDWSIAGSQPTDASDLVRCFVDAGAAPLASSLPLVLSIDPVWLTENEFIDKFEVDQAIFVLSAAALDDGPTVEACRRWRKKGRHLALQLDSPDLVKRIPPALFDHLSLDAAFARYQLPAFDLILLEQAGCRKIATGVGSAALFEWLVDNRFDYADSSFVTINDPLGEGPPDLARLSVLRLLNLVLQDADSRDIEEIFRQEARLSYNLLRLVNSVAVGARTEIGSFHQAIALLGRRQLQRWLQLLVYADQLAHGNQPNPLLQLAAARGRQMELLAAASASTSDSPEVADAAFITGTFSLLDILLKMPIGDILDELPLPSDIADALSSGKGVLGALLAVVVAGESRDWAPAKELLVGLGIRAADHAKAQVGAFYWASRINTAKSAHAAA